MFNGAFKIWWDRHNGNRWCWREDSQSSYRTGDTDVTKGSCLASRRQARTAVRAEVDRRAANKQPTPVNTAELQFEGT